MRLVLTVLVLVAMSGSVMAQQKSFDASAYQVPDGALTINATSLEVEPYFATKALIVATDAGLDTHDTALKWIAWMLPRQRQDGRIDRWCKKHPADDWRRCGDADADDSMLALWVELLYRNGTDKGLPLEWQQSVDRALAYEETLNNRQGVYHVSRKNHTPLLMDNVEIYSAFKDIGKQLSRWDLEGAAAMQAKSQKLADDIQRVFWDGGTGRFRSSTQKIEPAFYPDAVAQTYPWLEAMPTPQDPKNGWTAWKQNFAAGWLDKRWDPHPWGLVALTALKLEDLQTAGCWLQRSTPMRSSPQWNILEEASYQAVLNVNPQGADSCSELVSGQ